MLDVVPPQQMSPSGRKSGRGSKKTISPQSVVEVPWRLPARLRRPVRQELQRQRRKRQQREAIVRFERRPLYAPSNQRLSSPKAVTSKTVNPAASRSNTGAEQHTGDVYRDNRPRLAASIPPYAGSFLRGAGQTKPPIPVSGVRSAPIKKIPGKKKISLVAGERDIPYQWSESARSQSTAAVPPARKQFALPLHVSVWPFKRSRSLLPDKKKVQNSDSLTL